MVTPSPGARPLAPLEQHEAGCRAAWRRAVCGAAAGTRAAEPATGHAGQDAAREQGHVLKAVAPTGSTWPAGRSTSRGSAAREMVKALMKPGEEHHLRGDEHQHAERRQLRGDHLAPGAPANDCASVARCAAHGHARLRPSPRAGTGGFAVGLLPVLPVVLSSTSGATPAKNSSMNASIDSQDVVHELASRC